MEGWIKLHRSITNNNHWLSEPFSRSQAWVDLLLIANHKDGIIRVRGQRIIVKRGQVGWSKLRLSERWKWNRKKVTRFLNELERLDGQIAQQKNNVTTLITIVNYDKYQTTEQQREQQEDNKGDNRGHTNKNEKNVKNEKNINTTIGSEIEISGTPQENFEESNKNKKEKKKKPPPKKKKTLIAEITTPLERTKDNRHLRLAFSIWHLLEPHHGKLLNFKTAGLENWGADLKRLINKGAKAEEIFELTKWVLKNQPTSIPYFQSPNHLVKDDYKNYSRNISLKESATKKAHIDNVNTKANNSTPKKYKIFKPDNV